MKRMFSAALRRNVAGAAFENFQEGLLHSFARDVTGDADVVGLAADLVDLVNVNDPDLRPFHVVIGILQEPQDDVLHIFSDIARFRQSSGVGDAKGDIENFGESFGEERFA